MTDVRTIRLQTLWDESAASYLAHVQRFPTHGQITTMLAAAHGGTPANVLDFGCGPGNSTRLLCRLFPTARVVGLDSAKSMIGLARENTAANHGASYVCADITDFADQWTGGFDEIVCSNSFFHVDDKQRLLHAFSRLLNPRGRIVFSVYESVFRPGIPVAWPYARSAKDNLVLRIMAGLQARGFEVLERKEDREILDDVELADLFGANGWQVRCGAMLRLRRTPEERLSFFRIPAVAQEVFPDVPPSVVSAVIDGLAPQLDVLPQERTVYALVAEREDPHT
ncbi:class I SAM-dependent methyltransferase [Micromonospora sp. NPDC049523]|uniref:class I SAM-dependent methyltransferase n=1 Tax=Micromonospora sp. NPDC049523 TaxID=3155921 RepID=UPI0034497A8D